MFAPSTPKCKRTKSANAPGVPFRSTLLLGSGMLNNIPMAETDPELIGPQDESSKWLKEFDARVNDSGLAESLLRAASGGYRNPPTIPKTLPDGSMEIEFTDGPWKMSDTWRTESEGRSLRGTKAVINDEINLFWYLNYSGHINLPAANPVEVYGFLKVALLNPEPSLPIRGPIRFDNKDWAYYLDLDRIQNTLGRFKVIENIEKDHVNVYSAMVYGNALFDMNDMQE